MVTLNLCKQHYDVFAFFHDFLSVNWRESSKPFIVEDRGPVILYIQYHAYRCSGTLISQGINRESIGL